jgi:hypothetical protein
MMHEENVLVLAFIAMLVSLVFQRKENRIYEKPFKHH